MEKNVPPFGDDAQEGANLAHEGNNTVHEDESTHESDKGPPSGGQDGGLLRPGKDHVEHETSDNHPTTSYDRRWGGYTIPRSKPPIDLGLSDDDSDVDGDSQESALLNLQSGPPLWRFKQRSGLSTACFDPLGEQDTSVLTDFQVEYLTKYVTDVGYQPGLAESILKEAPVPQELAEALTKSLDAEMLELLPKGTQGGAKEVDGSLKTMGAHTANLMGPLLAAWTGSLSPDVQLPEI